MTVSYCDYTAKTRKEIPRGVAVGFLSLNEQSLLSLKAELGLSMSLSDLRFCQQEYRKTERRDPTYEEIFFFDALIDGCRRRRGALAVESFLSNDPEAVETYRDLLEKQKALSKSERDSVPQLAVFSVLLTKYLQSRSRRARSELLDIGCPVADPFSAIFGVTLGQSPEYTFSIDDSLPAVRFLRFPDNDQSKAPGKPLEGDAFILLQASTPSDAESSEDALADVFLTRLSLFASGELYKNKVHAHRVVETCGIAPLLATMFDGIYIELPRLPSVFDDGELYDLALPEHGSALIAVAHEDVEQFLTEAKHYALNAFYIARAIKGNRMSVRRKDGSLVSFPTRFIKELTARPAFYRFEGSAEQADTQPAPIPHRLRKNLSASDLSRLENSDAALQEFDKILCSAAGCPEYSFKNGILTALCAVFQAILGGAEPRHLLSTEAYSYPEPLSFSEAGKMLEAFLGVYRVMAELSICRRVSFLPKIPQTASLKGFSVYCFEEECHTPIPEEHFQISGSHVYLVTPNRTQNGFWDFDSIRGLLKRLSDLQKHGMIRSARVGVNEAPIALIESMNGKFTFTAEDPSALPFFEETMQSVFVIFESNVEIPEFRRIGRVTLRAEEETAPIEAPLSTKHENPAPVISRKQIDTPTVLLFPSEDGGNIQVLASFLRKNGFAVRIAPSLSASFSTDDVQIVIFCGKQKESTAKKITALKNSPRTMFALSELLRQDGIILAPNRIKDPLSALFTEEVVHSINDFRGSGIYVHDGLTEENAKMILNFYR